MRTRTHARTFVAGVAALAMGVGGVAVAQQVQERQPAARAQQTEQQQQQRARQAQRGQAGAQQQSQQGQEQLVQWLVHKNQGEIELSQFAQEKAQDQQVKQFAQKMIKDHQEFISKLQQHSGQQTAAQAPGRQQTAQPKPQEPQQARTEPQRPQEESEQVQVTARRVSGEIDLVQLHQKIVKKHGESIKKMLEDKEGATFDQAFMTQQAMAHLAMLDTLKVFQDEATGELQKTIKEGIQTTEQHMDEAIQILRSVEDKDEGAQAKPQTTRELPRREAQPQRNE